MVGFKADVLTSVFMGESGLKKHRVLCALGETRVLMLERKRDPLYSLALSFSLFFLSLVCSCAVPAKINETQRGVFCVARWPGKKAKADLSTRMS